MIYFCDCCHYAFSADRLPGRCPDCGKQALGMLPAVRPATPAEIADYERVRLEIMKEEKYDKLGEQL